MCRFDSNCFVGNWPFFRVKENTVAQLLKVHDRFGFTGGYVSSLEAIFYQDPYEAEKQLAKEIQNTRYKHIMILNPMLPAWKDDLARCISKLGVTGVRLMPGFHGYTLNNPVMADVIQEVKKYSIPMLLTLRMHDERMTWMYHPRNIPMQEVCDFVNCSKDVSILVNHIRPHEINQLNELGVRWDDLYVDISGFKGGMNAVEGVLKFDFLKGHIVFGSGAPLLETYGSVLQLETAEIDTGTINQVFSGNPFSK